MTYEIEIRINGNRNLCGTNQASTTSLQSGPVLVGTKFESTLDISARTCLGFYLGEH
jgi:hypothetical protein